MRWKNTETPTFAGNAGSGKSPAFVETMDLLDRNGNVVATFSESISGAITLNVIGTLLQSGATLAGAFYPAGSIDCSGNPNYPAANAGAVYVVSVAGKIGGASGITVQVGDTASCVVTAAAGTQAQVGASWVVTQGNVVSTADVPDTTDKRYVTDAQRTVLGNTSGTNTGDHITTVTEAEAASSITPVADGTVTPVNSITTSKGVITAIS